MKKWRASLRSDSGFTLVEILLVIGLVGILSVAGVSLMSGSVEEKRFDATVQELSALRIALVGDSSALRGGARSSFGYLGDMGSLPTVAQGLSALVAMPSGATAWTIDTNARFGRGWNGPYISPAVNGQNPLQDAWGRNYIYAVAGGTVSITSLGADGAAGGTGMDQDIVVTIAPEQQIGRVYGFLSSGGGPFTGAAQVELTRADGNGGVSSSLVSVPAASQGQFEFTGIPFGPRSIAVYKPTKAGSTQTLGPVAFMMDKPNYLITTNLTDFNPVNAGLGGGTSTSTNTSGGGGVDSNGNCVTNSGVLTAGWVISKGYNMFYLQMNATKQTAIQKIKVNTGVTAAKVTNVTFGTAYTCTGSTVYNYGGMDVTGQAGFNSKDGTYTTTNLLSPCPTGDNQQFSLAPAYNFTSSYVMFYFDDYGYANGYPFLGATAPSGAGAVVIDFVHSFGCDRITIN